MQVINMFFFTSLCVMDHCMDGSLLQAYSITIHDEFMFFNAYHHFDSTQLLHQSVARLAPYMYQSTIAIKFPLGIILSIPN